MYVAGDWGLVLVLYAFCNILKLKFFQKLMGFWGFLSVKYVLLSSWKKHSLCLQMYERIGSIQKWMEEIVKSVQTLDGFVAENEVKMYLI